MMNYMVFVAWSLLHPDDVADDEANMQELNLFPRTHYTSEQRFIRRDGTHKWVNSIVSTVLGSNNDVLFRVAMAEDITEKNRLTEELRYRAGRDPLTGLVNRRAFEERLGRILSSVDSSDTEHALCYLDLDQFKVINDACGQAAGDELLRQLGSLLPTHVRVRDTLARLGGDEFRILMEHCPLNQAKRVADSIHESFDKFRFFWDDKSFTVGISIGLVPIVGSDVTVADVLSVADSACYAAKEKGRNHLHVDRPDDQKLQHRHSKTQWFSRLGRALDEGGFKLHFQSIVPIVKSAQRGQHYECVVALV